MAHYQKKLAERKFEFWLKSMLATAITKEGLDEPVISEITKIHKEIIDKTGVCSQCSMEELIHCKNKNNFCVYKGEQCTVHTTKKHRNCPNGICDKFKDEIRKRHSYKYPSWKITNAERWCSSPFQFAKCYLPPGGYDKATSIDQLDLNGVLSIILNMKDILVQYDKDVCEQARDVTRVVRHSSSLEIEEDEMNEKLDILMQLLGCSKHQRAVEAKQKINQLKIDQLSITTDYVAKVLEDVIKESTQKSTTSILEETKKAVEEVNSKKVESIRKILEIVKGVTTSIIYKKDQNDSDITLVHKQDYNELKACFKEDLITLNKDHHGTIDVSPLFDKSDIPLQDVYVIPDTLIGDFPQKLYGDSSKESVNLLSLKSFFRKNEKKCREVHVTSKAGLGKTVFCKRLALLWCIAHENEASENQSKPNAEEIAILKEFDFLFFISLRDVSPNDCEVDAMIQHQIIDYMSRSRKYTKGFLEELLHKETCLTIIDGLDEWKHPETCDPVCRKKKDGEPHRKCRNNNTFITTSRPWKFREIKLKTSHIDLHLEITGLSKEASDELIKKTIQKLNPQQCDDDKVKEEVMEFNSLINKRNIHELKSDPLMLMYLTCLWFGDRKNFGNSRCDIYSSLVDLLLERAENKNSHIGDLYNQIAEIELPQCLWQHKHCRKYSEFLLSLGKLAFTKLFTKPREYSLVFELSSVELDDILRPVEAMFAKEVGFLTASKYGPREAKYSFYHKTMQEFFAALYLQHSQEFLPVISLIENVENIISNRRVLVFLCGLRPEVASNLSKQLCQKVSTFQDVQNFRCNMGSWNYFTGYNKTMKTYQDMNISCYKEYQDTFRFKTQPKSLFLYQEDVFIDEDFRKDDYSYSLKIIFDVNGPNVRSVKIRDARSEAEFQERIKLLKQKQIGHLEKIDLKCQIHEKDLCELLTTSKETLKCFVIKGGEWQKDKWTHGRVAFSNLLFQTIHNMNRLSELYLRTMKLSHDQLNGIVDFVSKRKNMKQIGLNFITCTDHGIRCPGVVLNLARHDHLKMFELGDLPLENVDINTASLEVCYVGNFPDRDILLKILNTLRVAPNLHVFACGFLEEDKDIKDMLGIMVELKTVQNIWLISIKIGDRSIPESSKMKNLQTLIMIKVHMTNDTFKSIVRLASLKDAVRVGLFDSVVTTGKDFEKFKNDSEFLRKCEVLLDEYLDTDKNEFLFKTVTVRRV